MKEEESINLVDRLCGQIEGAWREEHNRFLVMRLAQEYPEIAEELYDFFDALVLAPHRAVQKESLASEARIHAWLMSDGIEVALRASRELKSSASSSTSSPSSSAPITPMSAIDPNDAKKGGAEQTWVAFLRRRTGCSIKEIAKAIPHTSIEYLVLVGRHPDRVPYAVKTELARSIAGKWRIAVGESIECLEQHAPVRLAASRTRDFDNPPTSFSDLLDRAALSHEDKTYWLVFERAQDR